MMNLFIKLIAFILKLVYGYEALNILLKNLPSRKINLILRMFGGKIGKNVIIKSPFIIHNADKKSKIYSNLNIGNNCFIGRDCIFDLRGKITLHDNVTISHRAVLNTHLDTGNSVYYAKPYPSISGDIIIRDGTYIGSNVTILHSIKIGSNSIIGASSLVNRDIKDNIIAFGIPCRQRV
tara:strand:- start:4050 stop:4586 length:537 start_codon:yes stop_codon:yes gene_type:complete